MSEEEKKAINHIKNYPINWIIDNVNESAIKIVLNLIEKQQKEIEEKDKYIKAIADIRIQDSKENYSDVIDKYFISKDKIRELIKKYRILNNGQIEGLYNKEILALQELLEEN